VALLLTQSRGAWVGLAAAGFLMAVARRRWILPIGVAAVALFFVLPFTQDFAARFVAGLTNQDLATQMRFGEYKDALILIERYPFIGVGFAGVPDRDIYLGVSSLYLTIAEETGLIGLTLFAVSLLESYRYGLSRWRRLRDDPAVFDVWFGLTTALCGALISGIFDHFYFDLTFNGAAMMFWLTVGLMLAAARLSDDTVSQQTR
jgi:O-antigen ligase